MNTKTAFVPVTESEDICFAPPILTFVPQKSQAPAPQTPVAGTPARMPVEPAAAPAEPMSAVFQPGTWHHPRARAKHAACPAPNRPSGG